ncbi:MAG: hypothetical protein V1801_00380 [Candidatus Falkowbacteria bacterium]
MNYLKKGDYGMGRNGRLGNKMRGSSGKYLGRPSMCEKVPGEGACLKQLNSSRPRICMNCQTAETQTERIKVFGR